MYFTWKKNAQTGIDIEQWVLTFPHLDLQRFSVTLCEIITQTNELHYVVNSEKLSFTKAVSKIDPEMFINKVSGSFDLNSYLNEDRIEGFNLNEGPLFRFALHEKEDHSVVLIWSFHHILLDGRSAMFILEKLAGQYNNTPVHRKKNSKKEIEIASSREGFWENLLKKKEFPRISELVSPKAGSSGRKLYRKSFQLEKPLFDNIKKNLNEVGVSINSYIQTVWACVLYWVTSKEDIIFASVRAGRIKSGEDFSYDTGCFINTLPFYLNFDADKNISEILRSAMAFQKTLRAYDDWSLSDLADKGDAFSLQDNLFSILVYDKIDFQEFLRNLGGIFDNVDFEIIEDTGMPFSLACRGNDYLKTDIMGDSSFFTECQTDSFSLIFKMILSELHKNLSVTPKGFLQTLVNENEKMFFLAGPERQKQSVLNPLTAFTEYPGERIAIKTADKSVSYSELKSSVCTFAANLSQKTSHSGKKIGLYLPRTEDLIYSMFAVGFCGATFIPMDPDFPEDRLKMISEDCHIDFIITDRKLESHAQKFCSTLLFTEDLCLPTKEEFNIPVDLPKSPAYILYTSGSTGRPKGVVISWSGLSNFIEETILSPGMTETDRILTHTTISFDMSVQEIFLPLAVGGTMVLTSSGITKDPFALMKVLKDEKISLLLATPTTFQMLVDAGWKGEGGLKIISGGEALKPELVESLLERSGELWNGYGPTECTICCSTELITDPDKVSIGKPHGGVSFFIQGDHGVLLPKGFMGELCISGKQLARGYDNRKDLTEKSFFEMTLDNESFRAYRTGDLVSFQDELVQFHGRKDSQVKLRGFRIELGEIEAVLKSLVGLEDPVVLLQEHKDKAPALVAYYKSGPESLSFQSIQEEVGNQLPRYMIPEVYKRMEEYPVTVNGKINRKAFPLVDHRKNELDYNDIENPDAIKLAEIWADLLNLDQINSKVHFFDYGGNSADSLALLNRIKKTFNLSMNIVDIYQYPVFQDFVDHLFENDNKRNLVDEPSFGHREREKSVSNTDIAIIGLSGSFPGAENIDELWNIIISGSDAISRYTRQELLDKGVSEDMLDNPNYVYANGMMDGADEFDANFFGYTPREAKFMDPQIRKFLETCYKALEHSGYAAESDNNIGVYAGSGPNSYLVKNLSRVQSELFDLGELQTNILNGTFLSTNVSYKLNLMGPSLTIQTACSTSLVAVHEACLHLNANQCDIAIAGGVSIQTPRGKGYLHIPGEISSKAGLCRPFDKDADGTLIGEGSAAIVLKKLDDAIKDNDNIWAVIKGSAINNDGNQKAGYTAPSVDGQSLAVSRAQKMAQIDPEEIGYIEAHGTGTHIGDPIELRALSKVFSPKVNSQNPCVIGSVKANIGHLDAAAGVTGLIKTVLMLKHKQIPPSANYREPNPQLNLDESPFCIKTEAQEWTGLSYSRMAGISSFGLGGTNAHCIVQEGPERESGNSQKDFHLFLLSANSVKSLEKQMGEYESFLEKNENINMADLSYTLIKGRRTLKYRSALFVRDQKDLLQKLSTMKIREKALDQPKIVYLFTGQGSQYVEMAKGLYKKFSTFKYYIDQADQILQKMSDISLLDILYENPSDYDINQTNLAQIGLFVIQYALVQLLKEFGLNPDILLGHSIGEVTAACISGMLSFESALNLVETRGRLMFSQEPGAMLSINLPEDRIVPLLFEDLDISVVNAPEYCVVSGPGDSINKFEAMLKSDFPDIFLRKLKTSHGFHSRYMDGALENFREELKGTQFSEIGIPLLSNVLGDFPTSDQMGCIDYWARQIRSKVDFSKCINNLLKQDNMQFVEIGPGNALSALLSQHDLSQKNIQAVSTLPGHSHDTDDVEYFQSALAQIWVNGKDELFNHYYDGEERGRIPLPTYCFDREVYWVEPSNALDFNVPSIEQNSIDLESGIKIKPEQDIPELDIEKRLINIWEEYLGVSPVTIEDDFINLGGHSLLASQIINRINRELDIDLPQNVLLTKRTIKELLREVSQDQETKNIHLDKLNLLDHSTNLPLSQEQFRLWIVASLFKNPSYNIPFTYIMKGDLDIDLLIKVFKAVFKKHPIFYSRIISNKNNPYVNINWEDEINIEVFDFTEEEGHVDSILRDLTRKSFKFEAEPLYRIIIIKKSDKEYIFHLVIHHIIFDGWSWGVFVKDFNYFYKNILNNNEFEIEEPFSYFDYANWKKNHFNISEKSIVFWQETLKDYKGFIDFPYDFERNHNISGYGERCYFTIPSEISYKIAEICLENKITPFVSYFTAYSILLFAYSGDSDLCVGTPYANRSFQDLEEIVGFFVNMLLVRLHVDKSLSFIELTRKVNDMVSASIGHQDVSFDKIVEAVKAKRIPGMNPLFQIQFAWQNMPRTSLDIPGIESVQYPLREGVSPLDLTFYMWEENGQVKCEIEYNIDLIKDDTALCLKDDFIEILDVFSANPTEKIEDSFDNEFFM